MVTLSHLFHLHLHHYVQGFNQSISYQASLAFNYSDKDEFSQNGGVMVDVSAGVASVAEDVKAVYRNRG